MRKRSEGLGGRIAWLRHLSGLSVEDVVAASERKSAGVNPLKESTLRNLESGRKKDLSLAELVALSAALDLPPALLVVDFLRPFDASGVEPFDRLGMTNREVMALFPIGSWDEIGHGAGYKMKQLVGKAVLIENSLSELSFVMRSGQNMQFKYEDLRLIVKRRAVTSSSEDIRQAWEEQLTAADVLFSIRLYHLRSRHQGILDGMASMGVSIPERIKEKLCGVFSWSDETSLLPYDKAMSRLANLLDLSDEHALKGDDDSKLARVIIGNAGRLLGEAKRNVRRRFPHLLRAYFMISCLIAVAEDRPEVMSRIDFFNLDRALREVTWTCGLPSIEKGCSDADYYEEPLSRASNALSW
ncbi:helix-turn-helix domain-containing protein [Bifidobacterium aerophilum]|uniref:Helix-turn-helix domain-containing protein n=1 Tax=Bifidobacterium aerophilum TaxID=1798155 RepID=A0A6N9Z8T5_9BIFI|nr:helix-turn-helix transcriptional regulator [Bifidobacterium aerophilum]NEG90495.1 helix-turn-helix domain-containing protein [Bifidobacterium aerophilum]